MSKTSPFGIRSAERVAIFIDGPNLYSAARSIDIEIDFKSLLKHFEEGCQFLRAHYYTPMITGEDEFNPIKPLLDWLGFNGYSLTTRPMREITDDIGRRRHVGGNIAVNLAVDMLNLAHKNKVDHVVLFSGDSDLTSAVEAVQSFGIRVTTATVYGSQNGSTISDELRRQTDNFVNITDEAVKAIVARSRQMPRAQPQTASSQLAEQLQTKVRARA